MTVSTSDYALLAQDTYHDREIGKRFMLGGVAYRAIDHADKGSGFQATAYERLDTHEVIIAYRGTEFDREPVKDGGVDAGMVLTGINAQTPNAMTFTQKVMADAKALEAINHVPSPVTVTGHSLGGTLAEIAAAKYGLKGETFNAYGAAGLLEGLPAGGHQVIDHVRATDVVSAGSAHFGEVRIYAVQQDIDTLTKAGYRDDSGLLSPRDPLKAIDFKAHAIDNFVPDSMLLGHSIIGPQGEALYQQHEHMIDRYRGDVAALRTGLSAKWEIPKTAVELGDRAGHALANEASHAWQAAEHTATRVAHEANEAFDHAKHDVQQGIDRGTKAVEHGAHVVANEANHAWHAAEHTATRVAHEANEALDRAKHDVQQGIDRGTKAVEHGAHVVGHAAVAGAHAVEHGAEAAMQATERVYDNVRKDMAHGVDAAGHALHSAEEAIRDKASHAFDSLSHPGSWFDKSDKPQLNQPAHPDHALFQQARTAVHRLDAAHQRTPDQRSEQMAGALTVAARQGGLQRIDHVVLSEDSSRAYAVQGELQSSFKRVAQLPTAEAMATPLSKSSENWAQQHATQTHAAAPTQSSPTLQPGFTPAP